MKFSKLGESNFSNFVLRLWRNSRSLKKKKKKPAQITNV